MHRLTTEANANIALFAIQGKTATVLLNDTDIVLAYHTDSHAASSKASRLLGMCTLLRSLASVKAAVSCMLGVAHLASVNVGCACCRFVI